MRTLDALEPVHGYAGVAIRLGASLSRNTRGSAEGERIGTGRSETTRTGEAAGLRRAKAA